MGVVPKAKAGVGSAVNDATRLLGSALGVAVIGSVYVSLYNTRLTDRLPAELAPRLARTAHDSAGGALELANRTSLTATPPSGTPSTPRRPTLSSTASAPPALSPPASAPRARSSAWCCSRPIPRQG